MVKYQDLAQEMTLKIRAVLMIVHWETISKTTLKKNWNLSGSGSAGDRRKK